MTVRYTPSQLRSAIAIPPETYRHWKKALSPLRRDTRQNQCFTTGDLLAVALVRTLTTDFCIRVGAISVVAEDLFRICNDTSWPILERSRLIIDLANRRLELRPEFEDTYFEMPVLVFPLRSPVDRLREALITDGSSVGQQRLHFPPVSLPSKVEAASTGGVS